jgi:HSP20 family molecular chaperone IbpA
MAQAKSQEVATTVGRDVRRPNGGEATLTRPIWRPRSDIYETEDSVVVLAEMPGVAPDRIEVTLERQVLTIRGRAPEVTHQGYRQVYAEYGEGDYERVFTLSEHVDRDGIEATQKDGLLTLVLPKAAAAKPRRIEVRTA